MHDWQSVTIPFAKIGLPKWPSNNKNLMQIKSMLQEDGLINGKDYVILPEYYHRQVVLRFREPEHTSFYLLKWISSKWYNNT